MRTLLRPGWLLTHLVVVAIAVTFVSLGLWQVRRHGERQQENARIEQQLAADPIPLETALDATDIDLLPTTVEGTFLPEGELSLSPRSRNERPGSEVLTPLRLDDGRTLLVDRGWIPLDTEAPPPDTGEVALSGRLRAPRDSRQVLTDDEGRVELVSSVDLEVLEPQVDGLITQAWFEVTDEEAREAGVIPRPAEPVVLESGNHISYAVQWFAFTLIGLVGYPLLLRRRLAERDGEEDQPPGPAARLTRTADRGEHVTSK